ncbi:MAG: hypothetical protein U0974_03120 [Gemmatimonadales bacterium]|nr:hypothetical protein [Gemmatimonadales bacterium]MDZ4388705.1 hypothetical protein [Gemmatimonadales bacterium]
MSKIEHLMIGCIAVAAVALSGISTVSTASAATTGLVQCGAGVQNKCGEQCTDRTWLGACDRWEYLYNRTGD